MIVGGAGSAAERRYYVVPARTVKHIGLVLDQPAVATTIDTYISRNLPASFLLPFLTTPDAAGGDRLRRRDRTPLRGGPSPEPGGEYIVDDEDAGLPDSRKGNGRTGCAASSGRAFPAGVDEESEYAQFRGILNPPGQWTPVIMQNFYGRFVRSVLFEAVRERTEPGDLDGGPPRGRANTTFPFITARPRSARPSSEGCAAGTWGEAAAVSAEARASAAAGEGRRWASAAVRPASQGRWANGAARRPPPDRDCRPAFSPARSTSSSITRTEPKRSSSTSRTPVRAGT